MACRLPDHIADMSPHNFVPAQTFLDSRQGGGAAKVKQAIPEQTPLQMGPHWRPALPQQTRGKRLREGASPDEARPDVGSLKGSLPVSSGMHLGGLGSQGSDESSHSLHAPGSLVAEDGVAQQKRTRLRSRGITLQEEPEGRLWGAASPVAERPLNCKGAGFGEAAAASDGGALQLAVGAFLTLVATKQVKKIDHHSFRFL